MDKRDFLKTLVVNHENPTMPLNEFTTPLSRKNAIHLLRRMGFGPTLTEVSSIVGKTPAEAVNMLIGANYFGPADPTADWVNTPEENPLEQIQAIKSEIEGRLNSRYAQFVDWWASQMRNDSNPAAEKFVLFLHSIWCIQYSYDTTALIPPPLLYRNNKTLRKYRLSDYKTLALNVSLDGAMILFQSLYYSNKSKPNENYMRELMELFTMGIGNYTEADIREGSRALTGWRTAAYVGEPFPFGYFETWFDSTAHDIGAKTFMKETIAAREEQDNTKDQVLEQELKGILNIMFDKRGTEISKFIANKAIRYFIYSNPASDDSTFLNELASDFKNSGFSLTTLFTKIFTSEYFYQDIIKGIQIKTPAEFIIGLEKSLNVKYTSRRTAMNALEQELYNPPNVGSWKAYRTWVNTKTFPLRVKYANEIIKLATKTEIFDLAYAIPNYQSINEFMLGLEEIFFPVTLPVETSTMNLNFLKNESKLDATTWAAGINGKTDDVYNAIVFVIKKFVQYPDFQLT